MQARWNDNTKEAKNNPVPEMTIKLNATGFDGRRIGC